MEKNLHDISCRLLQRPFSELSELEQRVLRLHSERKHVSRDINQEFADNLPLGQRLADKVASFGGSWTFVIIYCAAVLVWVLLNFWLAARQGKTFDPYPFILLNLVLGMVASLQAPVIMMSQNRQEDKDRLDATHAYEVNLKAEMEILGLHEKVDHLREQQWTELIARQQEEIRLLTSIVNQLEKKPGEAVRAADSGAR